MIVSAAVFFQPAVALTAPETLADRRAVLDQGYPRAPHCLGTAGGCGRPPVRIGEAKGGSAGAIASPMCQSRTDWAADESLRFATDGTEVWPPAHYPVQVATVHHTATKNNDSDPEATVRAIYRYHAVDNGWGDIGYQYLIDESGVVYEGRWSGTPSTSCEMGGGDASDFAHEATDLNKDGVLDEMTTAAHTGGANSGNLGLALLGEFTDHRRTGGEPKEAAVTALEDVLTELAAPPCAGSHRRGALRQPGERRSEARRHHLRAPGLGGDGAPGGESLRTVAHHPHQRGRRDGRRQRWEWGHRGLGHDARRRSRRQRRRRQGAVVRQRGRRRRPPVDDAAVDGTWTTLTSAATCTNDATGTCTVTSRHVPKSTDALTLHVDAVTHAALAYEASANTDPDGDSDGTTITVNKAA